uniref:ZP domain-containing protein n=1 Tax=Poecilia formosa TaxID=48698 RepID=A0A096MF32_POEFO
MHLNNLLLCFFAATLATSCDSCHGEASCLESRERGDSFTSFSCSCRDGFVGDGLTCYDRNLCNNSSCCERGYRWSPDLGCVDVDECSQQSSPCPAHQICSNRPGSYECLQPSSNSRAGLSSQSVQFRCGDAVCPPGMDCIQTDGNARCADPCEHYSVVDDDWRSTNNTSTDIHCDRDIEWRGWYRMFLEQKSAQIPERCIAERRCGTHAPLWITESHPGVLDGIVSRTVCSAWSGSCCYFSTNTVYVKLCHGNYYVYKLAKPSTCSLAYCADGPSLLNQINMRCGWMMVKENAGRPRSEMKKNFNFSEVKEPPVQLTCGRDKLQVGLDLNSTQSFGLDPFSGHFAARNCSRFRVHGDVVWYEVEARAGACGNIMTTNGTHATFGNNLFLYSSNNESFLLPKRFPFSCSYPLETDTSLNVAVRPTLEWERGISGTGVKATASMSLFLDSSYNDTYPAGQVTLPVGSPLYVGVSVEEMDSNLAVVLENCFATHTSNPEDPVRYPLIENRCSTDRRQVSVVQSGSSLQARFTALLFLLGEEYREIYLHCSLSLCDQRRSNCVPVCQSRKLRSVSNSAALKPITTGPI